MLTSPSLLRTSNIILLVEVRAYFVSDKWSTITPCENTLVCLLMRQYHESFGVCVAECVYVFVGWVGVGSHVCSSTVETLLSCKSWGQRLGHVALHNKGIALQTTRGIGTQLKSRRGSKLNVSNDVSPCVGEEGTSREKSGLVLNAAVLTRIMGQSCYCSNSNSVKDNCMVVLLSKYFIHNRSAPALSRISWVWSLLTEWQIKKIWPGVPKVNVN